MKPEKVYACYNKDKEARLSSSSGAVFTSLADYVLNKMALFMVSQCLKIAIQLILLQ